jgi:DNA gyrase subunit A
VPEETIRGRGASIIQNLNLTENEYLVALPPEQASGYLALVSQSGMVRLLRHHVFGEYMKPGTSLYDYRVFGPLASACWTTGYQDLFIATREGRAIRFLRNCTTRECGLRISYRFCGISHRQSDSGYFVRIDVKHDPSYGGFCP